MKTLKYTTINCDTCFNKKYYPPQAIVDVCRFCKEKNMRFYRPDLTDPIAKKIVDITILRENKQ